ncbi:uncharacterized protein FRV6_16975 [Fusarium oxysporum]|uniref:Uncharacterized protein n=1 Tax=Fusarium oxysporum TaxID=5507 RepID=A0A2H3TW78_FUSOX|nr:uncharacterized protein FRV6_16975 [Fusarium oxysporum]
MRLIGKKGFK